MDMRDLLIRAAHTFWQAFTAVLAATFLASGINVSQIVDVDSAKRIGLAVLAAVSASALSAAKSTLAGMLAATPWSQEDIAALLADTDAPPATP